MNGDLLGNVDSLQEIQDTVSPHPLTPAPRPPKPGPLLHELPGGGRAGSPVVSHNLTLQFPTLVEVGMALNF